MIIDQNENILMFFEITNGDLHNIVPSEGGLGLEKFYVRFCLPVLALMKCFCGDLKKGHISFIEI